MRRLAVLLGAAAILGSCAYGRSASELRATTVGQLPDPPGSTLAWETFTPSEWNIDGPICAHLERTYASNDAKAFLAAIRTIAGKRYATYKSAPDQPVYDNDLPGYSPGASLDGIEGTEVQIDFHDLDDPAYRPPAWIDARAWRFVIVVRIWDVSGCHL